MPSPSGSFDAVPTPGGGDPGPVANASYVSGFALDPEMAEIVAEFVSELPDRINAFRAAYESGNLESLKRLSHQLKGAGAGYGFPVLGEAAGQLEQKLDGLGNGQAYDGLEAVRRQLDDLVELCGRCINI